MLYNMDKNAQRILDSLSNAIYKRNVRDRRNVREVAASLRDFIMAYLPSKPDSSYKDSMKNTLDSEFGLKADLGETVRDMRQGSIRNLLDAFDQGVDKSYLFGFSGVPFGYSTLHFDCVEDTVMCPVEERSDIRKRFIDLYGTDTVKLNIR